MYNNFKIYFCEQILLILNLSVDSPKLKIIKNWKTRLKVLKVAKRLAKVEKMNDD